jgi:hypothetical protein
MVCEEMTMSTPKTFQTVFGEAIGQGAKRAIQTAIAPAEREQAERIERQLRLVKDTTRRHTDLLSLLATT